MLGYWEWLDGLERGVAAHHAGMLPAFKEVVEELFQQKLVKVVFATETLALGINMPARTVVLEKLEKFNGEARVPITPGEYTQLTGRAGRRGIDVEGHSVIQWEDGLDPQAVASLASRRTYPLNSSFRPTYNMAVNLIEQFGRERTREILERSFAQFQADRAVVDLARKVRKQEESLAGYARGDELPPRRLRASTPRIRRELSDLEKQGARAERQSQAARAEAVSASSHELRNRMEQHPCHACPDREQHARWAERWWRLKRETDALHQQIRAAPAPSPHLRPRHRRALDLGYLVRDDHGRLEAQRGRADAAAHLRRARPARRRVPAARPVERPGCPRRSPRWPARWSSNRAARRATRSSDGPAARGASGPPSRRPGCSGASSTTSSASTGCPEVEPLATGLCLADVPVGAGRAARDVLRRPTWRRATSCAGPSRRSTCSTSSRSSPTARSAAPRALAIDAIRRGIVAYSAVA